MTPRDHLDDRETTASPQALVRDLRAQDGALPAALRRQCMAARAAMVPALIALLEAGLADDQAAPEGALVYAVDLLGALGDARAVPILLRCLEHDELFDGLALPAATALRTLGPAAVEGCLAVYAMRTNAAFHDRLAGVLSRAGVHDERLYACLVETLQRTPELGANYLAEYGEARALDVLAHTFDARELRTWTSTCAACDILVLSKNDADPGCCCELWPPVPGVVTAPTPCRLRARGIAPATSVHSAAVRRSAAPRRAHG
jgi:hypothetical protein